MDKNLGSKQIFLNLSIYQNLYEKGTKQMKKNSSLRRSSSKKNKKNTQKYHFPENGRFGKNFGLFCEQSLIELILF